MSVEIISLRWEEDSLASVTYVILPLPTYNSTLDHLHKAQKNILEYLGSIDWGTAII